MEKKISFVIPIFQTEKYLKRCIDSILDQDWPNKEIVCVLDGDNKECEKILVGYKNNAIIKTVKISHSGACMARNEGFRHTTGDIVSFFNSDYVALPDMIRTWMDTFDEFPNIGFVYSGYGWIPRDAGYYPSEEFDAYKLECYNYIDCGSPIKREVFKEWDINCKSLQDWDFFLRIVKSGVKGKFINGVLYDAELPRQGGLSDDSSHNWIERVNYVKKNHNIPNREICVCSFGAPKHALNVAKILDADYKPNPSFKPHNYKMIYLIGNYSGETKNFSNLVVFKNASKDCIKVIHWVGADIYWLRNLNFAEVKYLMPHFNNKIGLQLVECEQMKEEMEGYGLKIDEVIPIPPPGNYGLLPLPDEFTVAIMKTEKSDFDKYCGNLMDEIMAALPNVKFKVFGDGRCKRKLDNVENMGYVNMQDLIKDTSCILRIVRHDGMMMACNEFVMSGRDAITNLKMPYMEFVDTSVDKNNWDKFGAGFNLENYPDTKTKIIEKILDVKNGVAGNYNKRKEAKEYYDNILNKNQFKYKIQNLLLKYAKPNIQDK